MPKRTCDVTSKFVTTIREECHPAMKACIWIPRHLPETLSHSRTVLSYPPLASHFPSGLKTTLLTEYWCPSNRRTSRPLSTSHSRTVLYPPPLASHFPSGLKTTLLTEYWCP